MSTHKVSLEVTGEQSLKNEKGVKRDTEYRRNYKAKQDSEAKIKMKNLQSYTRSPPILTSGPPMENELPFSRVPTLFHGVREMKRL